MRHENKCDCGRMKVAGAIACSHCYSEARVRKSMSTSDKAAVVPFVDREGATHFTCEDCGRSVHCAYEARTCVCLACQFLRDHPFQEEQLPCPVCGNEERGQGGYLTCECPAVSAPRSNEPVF